MYPFRYYSVLWHFYVSVLVVWQLDLHAVLHRHLSPNIHIMYVVSDRKIWYIISLQWLQSSNRLFYSVLPIYRIFLLNYFISQESLGMWCSYNNYIFYFVGLYVVVWIKHNLLVSTYRPNPILVSIILQKSDGMLHTWLFMYPDYGIIFGLVRSLNRSSLSFLA